MAKKPTTATKPLVRDGARLSGIVTPVVSIVLTAALTAIGLAWLYSLWSDLPGPSLGRIDWEAVNRHRSRTVGTAREGLLLAVNSDQFTAALQNRHDLQSTLAETRGRTLQLRQTQLGRLHLAALVMLYLERAGSPPAEWWPSIEGYLAGLDGARFDHFMEPVLAVETSIYQSLGLRPGVAGQVAMYALGDAHLPFVQFLVHRLERIAAGQRAAGDMAAAESCERIVLRLLRQWLLDDGPPALRLLSAELLADAIESQGRVDADSAASIATKCRGWRAAYRAAAAGLPQGPAVLRVGESATPQADTRRVTASLAHDGWLASAVVALGLLSLLSAPLLFMARGVGRHAARAVLVSLVAGVVLAIIGRVCVAALPDLVYDDFRRLGSDDLGLPRLPFIAAGVGIVIALLAGCAAVAGQPGTWNRWSGVARATLTTWLFYAVLLLVGNLLAGRDIAVHERSLARPPAVQVRAIADPNAEGLLDELRAWTP